MAEGGEGRRRCRREEVRAVVRAAEEPRPVLWAEVRGVGKDVKGEGEGEEVVVEGVVAVVGWE